MLELIKAYYEKRCLKVPTSQQAILFAMTELGEACDLLLMKPHNGWTRNNPDKETFSRERFGEECWDAIMMLMVACMDEGIDPLEVGTSKLMRKMNQ